MSKLSIIKIATSYIMYLSRQCGYDYTADKSEPTIEECYKNLMNLINYESKLNGSSPASTENSTSPSPKKWLKNLNSIYLSLSFSQIFVISYVLCDMFLPKCWVDFNYESKLNGGAGSNPTSTENSTSPPKKTDWKILLLSISFFIIDYCTHFLRILLYLMF